MSSPKSRRSSRPPAPSSRRPLRVVVLPGDGVGPEVTAQAVRVLERAVAKTGRKLELIEMRIGGAAIDDGDEPLPERTKKAVTEANAVLLGAVGGPRWDDLPAELRPEKGLLALRQTLGVFANLRPVKSYPALEAFAPLKPEVVRGTDLVIVRELLGDLYFGEPRGIEGDRAVNTMVYTVAEIRRVAKVAFELARGRKKQLCSVDKANVLEVSQLWRRTVTEMGRTEFPDVALTHQYVDSCAMDLIRQPTRFDVLVTGNLFGDILTDEAAVIAGSIGLLPSASLGDGPGLYEPIHGSAPDIAGQGIANPIGTIASVAAMLRSSLGMPEQGAAVDRAVEDVLTRGLRTRDLGGSATTVQIGDAVCRALEH